MVLKKATIFDSNLWIAYLLKDDSQHKKAKTIFSTHVGPVLLPEYILLEVTNNLLSKWGKEKANTFLKGVMINKEIYLLPTEKEEFEFLIHSFQSSPYQKLSFVDHHLLLLSKHHNIITFDQALKQAIETL